MNLGGIGSSRNRITQQTSTEARVENRTESDEKRSVSNKSISNTTQVPPKTFVKQSPEMTKKVATKAPSFMDKLRNFFRTNIMGVSQPKSAEPTNNAAVKSSVLDSGDVGVVMGGEKGNRKCLGFVVNSGDKQVFVSAQKAKNPDSKLMLSDEVKQKLSQLSEAIEVGGDNVRNEGNGPADKNKIGKRLYIGENGDVSAQVRKMGVRVGQSDVGKAISPERVLTFINDQIQNFAQSKTPEETSANRANLESAIDSAKSMLKAIHPNINAGDPASIEIGDTLRAIDQLAKRETMFMTNLMNFSGADDKALDTTIQTLPLSKPLMMHSGLTESEVDLISTTASSLRDLSTAANTESVSSVFDQALNFMNQLQEPKADVIRPISIDESRSLVKKHVLTAFTREFSQPETFGSKKDTLQKLDSLIQQMETNFGITKSDVDSVKQQVTQHLEKRDEAFTGALQTISTQNTEGLKDIKAALENPTSSLSTSLTESGLTSSDVSYLKTIVSDVITLNESVSTESSKTVKETAKEIMFRLSSAGNEVRTMTSDELRPLIREPVAESVQKELSTETNLETLKSTLKNFDSLSQELSSDFGMTSVQLSEIKESAITQYCAVLKDESLHMSSSELSTISQSTQQFLTEVGASPSDIHSVCSQLDTLNNFAQKFNSASDSFDKVSPENKQSILSLAQHVDLNSHVGSAFIEKFGQLCEGKSESFINNWVQDFTGSSNSNGVGDSQYKLLRLVADFKASGNNTVDDNTSTTRFDSFILDLGRAAEAEGSVPVGHTQVEHKLHESLFALKQELANVSGMPLHSLGSLRFDAKTVSVIRNNFNTEHTDILLARVIDLQNKVDSGQSLLSPPSDTTMATIAGCGLIPDDQSVEAFKNALSTGVKNTKQLAQTLELVSKFAKKISKNSAIKNSLTEICVKDPQLMMNVFSERFDASISAAQKKKTISERVDKVVGKANRVLSKTKLLGKTAYLSAFGSGKLPSISKYADKISNNNNDLALLNKKIDATQDDLNNSEAANIENKFHVGSSLVVAGSKVEGEHLQMAQNIAIMDNEIQTMEAFLKEPSSGNDQTDSAVGSSIKNKLNGLAERKSKIPGFSENASYKRTMVSGHVKKDGNSLAYFSLSRNADGVVTETKVGNLSRKDAQKYLAALQKAKSGLKSVTTNELMKKIDQANIKKDLLSDSMNRYLVDPKKAHDSLVGLRKSINEDSSARKDLISQKDANVGKLNQMVENSGMKKMLNAIRQDIVSEVMSQMNKGASFEDVIGSDSLKEKLSAKLSNDVTAQFGAGDAQGADGLSADELSTLNEQTQALLSVQLSDLATSGVDTISDWNKGITLSSAAEKYIDDTSEKMSFESSLDLSQSCVDSLEVGDAVEINMGKFISQDDFQFVEKAAVDTLGLGAVSGSLNFGADKEDRMTLVRESDTSGNPSYSITLNFSKGSSFGAHLDLGGFLKFGYESKSGMTNGMKFTFSSPENAAGFLAGIRSGEPELALLNMESVADAKGNYGHSSLSITAGLTAPLDIGSSMLIGADVQVSKTEGKQVFRDGPNKTTQTSMKLTYSHDASILGDYGIKDQREFTSERIVNTSVREDKNRSGETVSSEMSFHQIEEKLTFNVNGSVYANTDSGFTLAEQRLGVVVDLKSLESQDPKSFSELKSMLRNFNPDEEVIVVSRTLSKDAVFDFNNTNSSHEKNKILSDSRNYSVSISKESTVSRSTSNSLTAGIVTVSYENTVAKVGREETTTFAAPRNSSDKLLRETLNVTSTAPSIQEVSVSQVDSSVSETGLPIATEVNQESMPVLMAIDVKGLAEDSKMTIPKEIQQEIDTRRSNALPSN